MNENTTREHASFRFLDYATPITIRPSWFHLYIVLELSSNYSLGDSINSNCLICPGDMTSFSYLAKKTSGRREREDHLCLTNFDLLFVTNFILCAKILEGIRPISRMASNWDEEEFDPDIKKPILGVKQSWMKKRRSRHPQLRLPH